jgi:uncharacterized DUF497 family protein
VERSQSRHQLATPRGKLRVGANGLQDAFAIGRLDDREDYGEERFVIIGMATGHIVLFVAYTEREERIRIISARRAMQHEQDDYFGKKV